ncbi:MAG TPA: hypothetical protein DDZ88_02375 [Verrucomicrobiales bacterium]|nr:hypothetical protein [Verrucomicrobiales bacterium]
MKKNLVPGTLHANPLWRSFLYFGLLVGLGFAVEEKQAVKPSAPAAALPGGQTKSIPLSDAWNARAAAIVKETDRDLRREGLTVLGREMGHADPQRSWEVRKEIFPFLPDLRAFSISLLRSWAMKEPQAALAACADLPEGGHRAEGYAESLEGWARAAPREAGDWAVKNLSGTYRRDAIARIGKVWAYKEPRLAAQWALQHSNEVDKTFVLAEVIETWAEVDALEASEWASRLPAGNIRDLALSKALFKWADCFPKTASEWLLAHAESLWLLPRVSAHWGRQEPVAAAAWLQQVRDESLVREAKQAIVNAWATYNPKAALDWTRANLTGDEREAALGVVMEAWASDYPLEALAWVRDIKGKDERGMALENLFDIWCRSDLDNAALWVKEQPPGVEKDLGTEQVAGMLISSDPPAALGMLLSMQDKGRLQQSLTRNFEDWKQREAGAAENWLRNHPAAVKLLNP